MTMNIAYTPRHFTLHEFLPRHVYEQLQGNDLKGWNLMDERILRTADQLRDRFGALQINTWRASPAGRNESGLRVPGLTNYSPYSQHSFGRAIDCISPSLTGDDMRKYILEHRGEFPFITAMETGISWLHVDCRGVPPIFLFSP